MSEGGVPASKTEKRAIFKFNLRNLVHSFCQYLTENPLFISNEILTIFMSIPSTFPVLMLCQNYYTSLAIEEKKGGV